MIPDFHSAWNQIPKDGMIRSKSMSPLRGFENYDFRSISIPSLRDCKADNPKGLVLF